MANIFQAVQTFQKSSLGRLLNLLVFGKTINPKFKNFNKDFVGNLGDTITYDLPSRFYSNPTLIVNTFGSVQQRVGSLTVNQQNNVNFQVTNQEYIFNLEPMDYMDEFGNSAMDELATKIESNLASNILTNTYRYYGDGVTPINSFQQLVKANTFYRNYGAPKTGLKVYIEDMSAPDIIASGLNQFVLKRNEELANSWELGTYNNADYYVSNLLPVHTAGNVGNSSGTGNILTVVSTNDPTGANITQITFSGASDNDSNAIAQNDLMGFQFNVSGQPNIFYRTFTGHEISANPVQIRATAQAASDGSGNVTVDIFPALSSVAGPNQNLSTNIVAGMQVKVLPSHRRGMILGGDAFYLGMPALPDQNPWPTANKYADHFPLAIRMTYGSLLGQNSMGVIYDEIHGASLVDEYAMALIFPL